MSSLPLQNSFPSSTSTTPMEDPHQPPPSHSKTYELKASSISYAKITTTTIFTSSCTQLPKENILTDISFTARPSELLAVVGPSGAGKSTLLDILAARTAPTEGQLKLNSTKFNSSAYRKISAHVPQHDYCLPQLTVEETFAFAARLLNTTTTTTIVTDLLSELNLTHLSNSRLSDHISGGERRRVSIGLALLHDPAILLLDEPTSGLDSSSAFQIMQTLKKIAQTRQRTVIVTIHQPSFKILDTIDSILLLYKGSVLHHGTLSSLDTYLLVNGYTVPPQLNSLEYAMEIVAQLHEAKSTTPQTLVDIYDDQQNPSSFGGLEGKITYRCSRVREITTLYVRFWRIMYRTRQLLMTNFLEAVGVGLLLGTLYIHVKFDKQGVEKRLGFFAFTLTFLLSSTTEALPIFINERPVLLRETASGVYRLSSHVIANTLVFLPYLLVMAFMYSASVYFLVGLCATWQAFGFFVLVTWVVVLMANSFVLFLSSLAPNYIAGTSLLTMSLAGFFLFSGYFIAKDKMPKYWLFMNYFSLYKYPLDALIENEYSCSRSKCFQWLKEERSCAMTGRDILEQKGLHEGQRWTNIQIMVGYFVLYRILYWAVLARRVSMSKK